MELRVLAREPLYLGVSGAGDKVVVDEADGLHEAVADRRPDECEATLL